MKIEILEQHGYHFLWIDDQLWMWDIPDESKYQKVIADQACGNVLVAGYGLGVIQKYLEQNPKVKSVHTIELYQGVIDVCREHFGEIYGSHSIGDFFELCPADVNNIDCVVGDVWVDIVPESLAAYCEFKEVALSVVEDKDKIFAWGQDFFEYLLRNTNTNKNG